MPTINHERLIDIAAVLLRAAGAPQAEAATVARHCIDANLAGHDSHGIIQIPTYIDRIERGHIVPGAPIEIIQESETTTVIDGNWGFGYVTTEFAVDLTIKKALKSNIAATTVFKQGHVGRVANYPLMLAEQGLIGMMTADSGRSPKLVAPFGGREARLGTNSICFAMPSNLDGPFFLDMATSAAAGGKVKLAEARGEKLPEGWLIDKHGRMTTDPSTISDGAVLLPLGGKEGYKGYGLSAMVEVLSGLLTGLGFGVEPTGKHNDGIFLLAMKVEAFRPLEAFKQEVADFAQYLKDTPPAEGVKEVFYPGELEHLRALKARAEGVLVEDATWGKLKGLAVKYGVESELNLE